MITVKNKQGFSSKKAGESGKKQIKLQLLRTINRRISNIHDDIVTDEYIATLHNLVLKNDSIYLARLVNYYKEKLRPSTHALILISGLAHVKENTKLVCRLLYDVIKSKQEITDFIRYYYNTKEIQGTLTDSELSYEILTCLNTISLKINQDKLKNEPVSDVKAKETEVTIISKDKRKVFTGLPKKEIELWEKKIESDELTYTELLQNLHIITGAGVSTGSILSVISKIGNRNEIRSSGIIPFDILPVYRSVQSIDSVYTPSLLKSLEKAIVISISNMKFPAESGKSVVICDFTGEMYNCMPGTKTRYAEIASLFKEIITNRNHFTSVNVAGSLIDNTSDLNIMKHMDTFLSERGPQKYFSCIEHIWDLVIARIKIDNLFIFTCSESMNNIPSKEYISLIWDRYKKVNPDARLFMVNLDAPGQVSIKLGDNDFNYISGYNRSVFELMNHAVMEEDKELKTI